MKKKIYILSALPQWAREKIEAEKMGSEITLTGTIRAKSFWHPMGKAVELWTTNSYPVTQLWVIGQKEKPTESGH